MTTLHIVPHTHWDREWYLTFQEFRFRLVHLMDKLLDLLDADPGFDSFLLDGQTIALDDYLEIRPEEEARVRRFVQEGRLLIGPWYVLPDEFLVGSEALIRNALLGGRGCRRFVPEPQPMERIGYLPDPFGHISQLPQIAAGLGMEALCFWRGVGEAPTEFIWVGPDGSECLVLYLRTSYSNAARLATDEDRFIRDLATATDSLLPHAVTSHLLLMHGTDHMEPRPDLAARLRAAGESLQEQVLHSTLPGYLAAVQAELGDGGLWSLTRLHGELRSPQTAHLLPAVLSARMWIKQWNHRCETLLTRWAEPFAALAGHLTGDSGMQGFLRQAWIWLLKNHPHDSICGCSVDQVHREMRARFAWTEQIAEQVTRASLDTLARNLGSLDRPGPSRAAPRAAGILVFNPLSVPTSDRVQVHVPALPEGDWTIVDDQGSAVPARLLGHVTREHFNELMGRDKLLGMLAQIVAGSGPSLPELSFVRLETRVLAGIAHLDVVVASRPEPVDPGTVIQDSLARVQQLLADEQITAFRVRVIEAAGARLEFVAQNIPPVGYAPFSLQASGPATLEEQQPEPIAGARYHIENELLSVEADPADGTVTIVDKATGLVIRGANRFSDTGDRGDEYTYTPPEHDSRIHGPVAPPEILREVDGIGQSLRIQLLYRVPHSLEPGDRTRRSDELVDLPITSVVRLTPGIHRVEFETTIANHAQDHRLRVHFPTPIITGHSWAESQFDVVTRPIALPTGTDGWAEQPVGTHPQLTFCDLSDGKVGVMLANRGLPEYEALPAAGGAPGVTLALTLLRCVGWLSRGDLHNRVGHAGPAVPTPEAQCPGDQSFHYAVIPHSGNYLAAMHEAHAFSAGLRGVCLDAGSDSLPARGSFLEISPAAVVLSTIKVAEDRQGLIVRLYNSAATSVEASLRAPWPFRQAALVPLHEVGIERELDSGGGTVTLPLKAKEIVTLRFTG